MCTHFFGGVNFWILTWKTKNYSDCSDAKISFNCYVVERLQGNSFPSFNSVECVMCDIFICLYNMVPEFKYGFQKERVKNVYDPANTFLLFLHGRLKHSFKCIIYNVY